MEMRISPSSLSRLQIDRISLKQSGGVAPSLMRQFRNNRFPSHVDQPPMRSLRLMNVDLFHRSERQYQPCPLDLIRPLQAREICWNHSNPKGQYRTLSLDLNLVSRKFLLRPFLKHPLFWRIKSPLLPFQHKSLRKLDLCRYLPQ